MHQAFKVSGCLLRQRAYYSSIRFASSQIGAIPNTPSTTYTAVTHPDVPRTVSPQVQEVLDRSKKYTLHVYARHPFALSYGKGAYLWDMQGNRYLDFTAGIAVNALGHADEGVIGVMSEQAGKLLHTSNLFHHEWAGKLAELLVTLTQRDGGLGWQSNEKGASGAKIFFANSGTEANEGALKIARLMGKTRWAVSTGKSWDDLSCDKLEIVCFENGFHGRSMGALSVTNNPKYQKPFTPLIPGVKMGQLNEMEDVGRLIGERTCAVIVEPIQGEGGVNAANTVWLKELRKRCNDVGAVLIYDEIQCGLFRTGKLWAHSILPVDCHPDIVTMAKPLANGYPIGAVMIRDDIADVMSVGMHGTTFGGSPLACAIGYHVLSRLSDNEFLSRMAETSSYLYRRLSQLPEWFPDLISPGVRGRGFILGLGFQDESSPSKLVGLARERGVLLLTAGKDAVRIVPSLNIGAEEVDVAVDVIESCLHVMNK